VHIPSPFLVESHRTCFILPPSSCGGCCLPRKLVRDSVLSFHWATVKYAASAQHVPKFQTPTRKAGVHHKLYYFINHLGIVGPLLLPVSYYNIQVLTCHLRKNSVCRPKDRSPGFCVKFFSPSLPTGTAVMHCIMTF
jgi:hypothetical protein